MNIEKDINKEAGDITAWDTLGDEVPFSGNSAMKTERLQNERAQEMFERDLSDNMTDIEELELFAESGVDGLSIETKEFDGKNVKIIHANGYPMKFLKHWVNSGDIRKNPSIWTKKEQEFDKFDEGVTGAGFNPDKGVGASNVISTTYVDTDVNAELISGNWAYIFTKIRPDSVIRASSGDAYSTGNEGKNQPYMAKDYKNPTVIAEESRGRQLNEVVVRRYDENGSPLYPTAILSHSTFRGSVLDDDALRSATYFNIPVIEANLDFYRLNERKSNIDDSAWEDTKSDDENWEDTGDW